MSFFEKLRKVFSWIPFLWKMDNGSYISLYQTMIKQMTDMQDEIVRFGILYKGAYDFCLQIEECKNNLQRAIEETDEETAQRYIDRGCEIMKQYSMEWWI